MTKEKIREHLEEINLSIDMDKKELKMTAMVSIMDFLNVYKEITITDPATDSEQFCLIFEYLTVEEYKKLYLYINAIKDDEELSPLVRTYLSLCYMQMLDFLKLPCLIFEEGDYVENILRYAGKYINRDVMEEKHTTSHFVFEMMDMEPAKIHSSRIHPN